MSKTSDTDPSVRLKRDHPNNSSEESISSTNSLSPPIKKLKHQHNTSIMNKETSHHYPNGSLSTFIPSNSTKKLVIKNLKSLLKKQTNNKNTTKFFHSLFSFSTF